MEKKNKMRAVCDVCEAAPARIFCAADQAAMCTDCDEKVRQATHHHVASISTRSFLNERQRVGVSVAISESKYFDTLVRLPFFLDPFAFFQKRARC